jgi:hypothetical protein
MQFNLSLCFGVKKFVDIAIFFRQTKQNDNAPIVCNIGRHREQNLTTFWPSKILFTNVPRKTQFNMSLCSGVNKFADTVDFLVKRNKSPMPL